MKIKEYLKLLDSVEYHSPRLYGSAVMVEYKGRRTCLSGILHDLSPHDEANRQNLTDVMTAVGSGGFFHLRRTNKRARWIRKLILRKMDLAK